MQRDNVMKMYMAERLAGPGRGANLDEVTAFAAKDEAGQDADLETWLASHVDRLTVRRDVMQSELSILNEQLADLAKGIE